MDVNAPPSILSRSEILASGNMDVYYICAWIGFHADSLEPLRKIEDHGFTPEAILDLHVTCDHDTELMINALQALDSDSPPLKARSSDLSELCDLLSSGDLQVFRICIFLYLRAQSLEPLRKIEDHGFTPEAILDLHVTCDHDTERMINALQALE